VNAGRLLRFTRPAARAFGRGAGVNWPPDESRPARSGIRGTAPLYRRSGDHDMLITIDIVDRAVFPG